jgi:hypothetical protein
MHYCGKKKDAKNPTLGFGTKQVAKTVLATIGLMRFKNIAEKAETHINKLSPTKVLLYFDLNGIIVLICIFVYENIVFIICKRLELRELYASRPFDIKINYNKKNENKTLIFLLVCPFVATAQTKYFLMQLGCQNTS